MHTLAKEAFSPRTRFKYIVRVRSSLPRFLYLSLSLVLSIFFCLFPLCHTNAHFTTRLLCSVRRFFSFMQFSSLAPLAHTNSCELFCLARFQRSPFRLIRWPSFSSRQFIPNAAETWAPCTICECVYFSGGSVVLIAHGVRGALSVLTAMMKKKN